MLRKFIDSDEILQLLILFKEERNHNLVNEILMVT